MAANPSNFVSPFAPQSHFFTDPALITQSEAQAFGPASPDVFHVTTSFNVTTDAPAFAICPGVALVQPQTGSNNLVNLILRPFKQPITGINIKYFVYRGLKKADFFNGDKVIQQTTGTSDFANRINTAFNSYYAANPAIVKPDFLAKFIGFDPANQPDSMPISGLFFKQSEYVSNNGQSNETAQTSFELPMMPMGASLGRFANGECGIDIVLNYGDYQLPASNDQFVFDLAYARDNDYSIDLTQVTDAFQKKLIREQIFQFLDAAAYFGFHSTDQGAVTVNNNGTKIKKTGQTIYTDVIQNFQTKNNLYLYIQSDRTRSYNFYENYGISDTDDHSLLSGYTESTLTPAVYSNNGWPLIIDNAAQSHNDTSNRVYLQLVTDNNVNTMLYGQIGRIENAQSNNFSNADYLILPINNEGTPTNLTKAIILNNPNIGPNNAKQNIATFYILLYQGVVYDYVAGQTPTGVELSDIITQPSLLDDIFGSLLAIPVLKTTTSTGYTISTSQKIKLINHYFDGKQNGISAIQSNIVNDIIETGIEGTPMLNRVAYITETIDVLTNVFDGPKVITHDTKSTPSLSTTVGASKTYTLPAPFYLGIQLFTENNQLINGVKLLTTDGSVPNKFIIGLTQEENELLKAFAILYTNVRIALLKLSPDDIPLKSAESIDYYKFKIALLYENSAGDLVLNLPASDILVYSLDIKYYFSVNYSKYISQDSDEIKGDIYNEELNLA
ncbi:hypothetical protein ABID99_000724 [Mucilaginibacter sp. OAE612]|uniref:hypothetical protein n=1 Tax=Mucilaginibacter sp. OAE612 TaxID=3156444 RepID=UPI00359DB83C